MRRAGCKYTAKMPKCLSYLVTVAHIKLKNQLYFRWIKSIDFDSSVHLL